MNLKGILANNKQIIQLQTTVAYCWIQICYIKFASKVQFIKQLIPTEKKKKKKRRSCMNCSGVIIVIKNYSKFYTVKSHLKYFKFCLMIKFNLFQNFALIRSFKCIVICASLKLVKKKKKILMFGLKKKSGWAEC